MVAQDRHRAALWHIAIGLTIALVAGAITWISYQDGGRYVVLYGAIFVGIIETLNGLARYFGDS